jgi:hypothetical protein
MSYSHSFQLGVKLATGKTAREERIRRALGSLGNFPPSFEVVATGQNSSSIAVFPSGLRVLISYTTAVAYRLPDGSFVATPRNEYSRTTDRAVCDFAPAHSVTLEVCAFRDALARHLSKE